MKLRNGWYIINYHNIDWVDNDFLSSFRLTTSPNMLEEHLKYFSNFGTIVSFELGYKYLIDNSINFPMFSFSFDDGYYLLVFKQQFKSTTYYFCLFKVCE